MRSLLTDIRYAIRRLAKTPAFTVTAVVTLALAIGANTAIYSVVDALMIRALPYRDPAHLTELGGLTKDGRSNPYFKSPQLLDWRRQTDVFEALEGYTNHPATLAGAGEPQTVLGAGVTGGLMPMLGVSPLIGRTISEPDARAGRDGVVVVSENFWRRRMGGDPKVLGRTVQLDDRSYEIIGVMPRAFNFPFGQREFWVPVPLDAASARPMSLTVVGRLPAGVSMDEAQARADVVSARLVADRQQPAGWKLRLDTMVATHMNTPVRRALFVLAGAVLLVLLSACANVANLLLIEGTARRREVAVRTALGASRARVIRQLLAETLVLALLGGSAGLLIAQWGIDLLAAFTPRDMTFLTVNQIALNGRVLGFALALTVLTSVLFGLLPAIRTAGTGPAAALSHDTRTGTGGPRAERLRRGFVLAQLALSLMLLVGAGLLMRTFVRVSRQAPGFDPENLVVAELSLPRWKYQTAEARQRFDRDVLTRVLGVPGVQRASIEDGMPPVAGGIHFAIKFEVEGRGVVLNDPHIVLPFNSVGSDYFDLMRIPLRRGRAFTAQDSSASPAVAVISQSLATRLFGTSDPVGHRLRLDADDPWLAIVGVVGDVYEFDHERTHDEMCLYYARSQSRFGSGYRALVVRASVPPASLIGLLKQRVWEVDPVQPIQKMQTIDAAYAEFLATPRFYAWLMGTFAAIGLAIAAIGLYGVLAYANAQRTREFGIRIALGASSGDVLRLVLGNGLAVTVAGLVAGVLGSVVMTRALQSLLVDVSRLDAVTYATMVALFAIIALAAAWIPARRAARTDPAVTLRYD